jgi:hypothetical protein
MEIPWPKLLSILSSGSVDGAKCELRLLDCVFNDGVSTEGNSSVAQASISEKAENNQLHWYFTTRSGVISKKKADNIKAASIVDRFVKFALANPNNVGKYVGVSIENSSNHRSLYRDWEFAGVVEKYLNSNSASSGDSYLQVYIRPLHGKDVYYTFHATRERRGNYSMYVQTLAEETYQNDPLVNSNAAHAIAYGKKVVEFLHFGCGLLVDNISIEMVVDDNTHVWLSHVPLCVGEQVSRSTAAKEEAEGIRSVSFDLADPAYISSKNSQAMAKLASQKSAQLPQLKPSSSSSSRGLASHASMPALLHADGSRPSTVQSSRPGSVSSHANIGSSAAQASSSSSSLIYKDSTAYRCNLGPDDLPAIKCWHSVADNHDSNNSSNTTTNRWTVDLSDYLPLPLGVYKRSLSTDEIQDIITRTNLKSSVSMILDSNHELRAQRAADRVVENAFLINMLRVADSCGLLGATPSSSGSSHTHIRSVEKLENSWRQVYADTVTQYGRDDGTEVVVCGNVAACCRKIALLMEAQFRSFTPTPTQHQKAPTTSAAVKTAPSNTHPNKQTHTQAATVSTTVDNEISAPALADTKRPSSDTQLVRNKQQQLQSQAQALQSVQADDLATNVDSAITDDSHTFADDLMSNEEEDSNPQQQVSGPNSQQQQQQQAQQPRVSSKTTKRIANMATAYTGNKATAANKTKSALSSSGAAHTHAGVNTHGDKTGKSIRKAMEDPPNVDLIAKFAAEKEL